MSHADLMFPPSEVLLMSTSTMNGNNSPSPENVLQQQQQLPQALQNLQRILQSQLANVNPLHLQQAIQRQQHQQLIDAGRKQLEQMLQQMQEQLQINILQQTHMGSTKSGGNALTLQQLQQQQQHILGQMQIIQQALMLGQGLEPGHIKDGLKDRQRHDSATFGSIGSSSEGSVKENRPDNNNTDHLLSKNINGRHRRSVSPNIGRSSASSPSTPVTNSGQEQVEKLFVHGHCQWPGCDASVSDFGRHLATSHPLDDKTTAQTRVQLQIVNQLEFQLSKEKDRLNSMMKHLRLELNKNGDLRPCTTSTTSTPTTTEMRIKSSASPISAMSHLDLLQSSIERGELGSKVNEESLRQQSRRVQISPQDFSAMFPNLPTSLASLMSAGLPSLTAGLASSALASATRTPSNLSANARAQAQQQQSRHGTPLPPPLSLPHLSSETPIRPKPPRTPSSEMAPAKMNNPSFSLPAGFDERRGRGDRGNPNLDPAMDIKQNQEFYRHNDVRPPYTYAALIRYAIQESPDQQLTLHEIYNWFTTTFAYFRRNAASWKNAVRHNLSLHKCFMRVENVKGAVWTVDDNEYYRRRPARGSSNSASASPTLTPQTPSMIDQSFSSMFGASASAMLASGKKSTFDRLPFFSAAMLQDGQFKQDNGMESPPASLDNRSTPGSLDLSRSNKRMDSSPMYSNDSNDEGDDDLAPPTMVPRADLKPGGMASLENRGMEEDEDFEERDLGLRSGQNYLDIQRRALEQYEAKLEQDYRAGQEFRSRHEDDKDDIKDLSMSSEPNSKKLKIGTENEDESEERNSTGSDSIKREMEAEINC